MTIARISPTLLNGQSLGANFDLGDVKVEQFVVGSIQIVWVGVTDVTKDGSLSIEMSNDNTNWQINGTAKTIDAAAGTHVFELVNITTKYLRIAYIANAITTGTVTATAMLKSFE